jgi:hypothetical protein
MLYIRTNVTSLGLRTAPARWTSYSSVPCMRAPIH